MALIQLKKRLIYDWNFFGAAKHFDSEEFACKLVRTRELSNKRPGLLDAFMDRSNGIRLE